MRVGEQRVKGARVIAQAAQKNNGARSNRRELDMDQSDIATRICAGMPAPISSVLHLDVSV
jgi:hypothetical protein